MFRAFKDFIKKYWNKWIWFLCFARDHRIKLKPEDWGKGVLCLLLGWGLIAVDGILFKEPLNSAGFKINFIIQFASGMGVITLYIFMKKFFVKNSLGVRNFLKITHENERSGAAVLEPKSRKGLIFTRGLIGAGGYIGFELARSSVGLIDNAVIYGADSLMYVILSVVLLKEKYNFREKIGIFTVIIGIGIVVYFDLISMNRSLAIKGCIMGLTSSISLAIILILTSVIVQHDSPIRVVFYQCFYGLLIALIVFIVSINEINLSEILNFKVSNAIISGVIYAIAVIFFLQSFYYVDPIIVAISSYSLDLYSVILGTAFDHEIISFQTLISLLLIAVGSGILIRAEYQKHKKKSG